jgi:hypothetical protein
MKDSLGRWHNDRGYVVPAPTGVWVDRQGRAHDAQQNNKYISNEEAARRYKEEAASTTSDAPATTTKTTE